MKNLNLTTALFICSAFVFRILFFNIFTVSSLNSQQDNSAAKTHLSMAMKRRMDFQAMDSEGLECSLGVISEAVEANDDQLLSRSFFLVRALYSIIAGEITSKLKAPFPFQNYLSGSSNRYLVLQVLRT